MQDLIQINPFSRDGRKLKSKRGIVLHYTASPGAPAKNISRYFIGLKDQNTKDNVPDRYAGAHFSVDRQSIVQSIPTNERGYHCGSSQPYLSDAIKALGNYPNDTTVGIEMCIEADGSIHEDTFQNATDIVVHLIRNEGFPEVLFTHKGVVGWKDCPLPWVRNPSEFERFKKLVNDKLKGGLEMLKEDANKIINKFLKPDYECAKKQGDPAGMKEAARLANELRKVSGQPIQ
jgi:N-acetylmuramoyl-L-alanine amidase